MSPCRPSCLTQTRRLSLRGFTLPELAIVGLILSVLGLVLVETFVSSNSAVSLGTAKIERDQTSRQAMERIIPLVMTATDIVQPVSGAETDFVRFSTTEDFLDPNYDPRTWGTTGFNPGVSSFEYVIYFYDPNTANNSNPGEIRLMRQSDYQVAANRDAAAPTVPYTRLAGKGAANADGTGIVDFTVRGFLITNSLECRVKVTGDVKRASGDTERVGTTDAEDYIFTVQMPRQSYQ